MNFASSVQNKNSDLVLRGVFDDEAYGGFIVTY